MELFSLRRRVHCLRRLPWLKVGLDGYYRKAVSGSSNIIVSNFVVFEWIYNLVVDPTIFIAPVCRSMNEKTA
jgi:hypothetical protein